MLRWDSPVMQFLRTALSYVFVTLLLALCSLPLLSFGAAACAAYDTVRRCLIREEGRIAPCFFKSFAGNFRQATLLWLVSAAIGLALWQGIRIMEALYPDSLASAVLQGVLILCGILALAVLLYGLASVARFSNRLPAILQNSLRLALANGLRTLGLLLLIAAGGLLIRIAPLTALIVPALLVFFWCRCMERAFAPYLPPETVGGQDDA